jgi:hypothetical protein
MRGSRQTWGSRGVVKVQVEPPQEGRNGTIGMALTLATGAAGLVAYLYLLGGVVTWLRLTAVRLPADAGIVATESKRLLAIGARVAAFELLLLLLVAAAVTVLAGLAIWRRGALPPQTIGNLGDLKDGWENLWTLGGMIGPATAVLLIVVGVSIDPLVWRVTVACLGILIGAVVGLAMVFSEPPENKTLLEDWNPRWRLLIVRLGRRIRGEAGRKATRRTSKQAKKRKERGIFWVRLVAALLLLVNVVAAVVLVPFMQGTALLAATMMIYAGTIVSWPTSGELREFLPEMLRSSGVWLGLVAATMVALAWVATPPVEYPQAEVFVNGRPEPFRGAYIDRTSAGLYLGICVASNTAQERYSSTEARVELIPVERLRRVTVGGGKYVFDPGGRPSLAQVLVAGFGATSSARARAPLHHSLRRQPTEVCGQGFDR